ncbi:RecQ family ATP-dependent DNA helicase [Pararhodospirillum photometricum]|nr:RecQ family ATP-dependent DNA helicase [Pararhodospirillum photometricum]
MTDRATALSLLRRALNNDAAQFRPGQWEAIDALVNERRRLFVVQQTGWGKSSVYFIATRLLRDRGRGLTLIVSPLLALMRNQIEAAKRLGLRALTINSTNHSDWQALHQEVRGNQADALLISPERLANDDFVTNVLLPIAGTIGLLVVDEAHCISDWGHDFRPDYRRLVNVLQRIPRNVPILGTTATANHRVIADVKQQLGAIDIQRGALTRETLALQTLSLPSQAARLAWLVDHVPDLPGTGIIYTLTKRDATQVADWLTLHGIAAKAYHSEVMGEGFESSDAYRQHLEDQLLNNKIKALVATTALGMGYDKPDLGFVVHYQAPGSIVAYYQQVGRAGRGIDHALGILMSGEEDSKIHDYFRRSAFPRESWVRAILEALDNSDGLSARELEGLVNLRQSQIEQVLKILSVDSPAPVLKDGSTWRRTPVPFRLDHKRIQRLTEQREEEWAEVQDYLKETGCLMEFLARALDDADPHPCGKCANCLGRPVADPGFTHHSILKANRFLRHSEIVLECKKQVAKDAFVAYGFKGNLPGGLRAQEGRILSQWGDDGWGRMVAEDKHHGHFRDDLVGAMVEMVRERWKPQPSPTWVTCVPSRNHPTLVPDFAQRFADALDLPFVPAVHKVKDNGPQKAQQNRFHQCRNLDGVFALQGTIPRGPVLLVDDVVDSAWTMTIIAALLRQAGSGPVWPVALTTSNVGG